MKRKNRHSCAGDGLSGMGCGLRGLRLDPAPIVLLSRIRIYPIPLMHVQVIGNLEQCRSIQLQLPIDFVRVTRKLHFRRFRVAMVILKASHQSQDHHSVASEQANIAIMV